MWPKTLLASTALLASVSTAQAFFNGIALEPRLPNGECRTRDDWQQAFTRISNLMPANQLKAVRLYTSWTCDTLEQAIPAAMATSMGILVGIWIDSDSTPEAEANFASEKGSLIHAIQGHGSEWMLGVTVGSGNLYFNETTPSALATKIYDVRGMINSVGCHVPVGHADSPSAWTDPANAELIAAVDYLGVNNYPYWRGMAVDNGVANNDYWQNTNAVRAVAQGKEVWTTETGQPNTGTTQGGNIPSVTALQNYWWQVACTSMKEMNFFFYDLDDFDLSPTFAIVDRNYNPLIDMTCH